jgi:hypothetical protein
LGYARLSSKTTKRSNIKELKMVEQDLILEAVKDIEVPELKVNIDFDKGYTNPNDRYDYEEPSWNIGEENTIEVNNALFEIRDALRELVQAHPNNDVLTDQIHVYLEDNFGELFDKIEAIEEETGFDDLLGFRTLDHLYDSIIEE